MQECRVCGLLFLGGGACPSCGSQVSLDIKLDDVVMDDESIPGLDDVVDAIGSPVEEENNSEILPFGMGAKAEVLQSSLPFGVGSFSDGVGEVAIPLSEQDLEQESELEPEELVQPDVEDATPVITEVEHSETVEFTDEKEVVESPLPPVLELDAEEGLLDTVPEASADPISDVTSDVNLEQESSFDAGVIRLVADAPNAEMSFADNSVSKINIEATPVVLSDEVPEMWRIDAAEVDMDEITANERENIFSSDIAKI